MHRLTAQQLANVHTVGDHAVNPVSGEIVFTWNAPGYPALFRLPPHGGPPLPLVREKSAYASWAPDGRRLLFLRDAVGAEADDLFLLDARSGEQRPLTRDDFGYTWPRFTADGRVCVLSNREGSFDPYEIDPATGAMRQLARGDKAASSLLPSPDGRWLGYFRLSEADEQGALRATFHLLDRTSGKERQAATLGGDLFHAEWSWRPSAPPLPCLPADRDEYQALLLLHAGGRIEWLPLGPGDKSQPQWAPGGKWLAFLHEEQGDRRLRLWSPDTEEQRDLSIGEGVHHQPRWAPDGQSLTVIFESATRPPDLWRVGLDGATEQLTEGLPDGLPRDALTAAEHVTFPTFDEWRIPALLYSPREANGAAVVWLHGGPAGAHRNGWYSDLQLLMNQGYTVLAPNVRGSSGFGKSFRDLSRMDWGGGELRDLAAANHFLRERQFHRIGVLGGSLGGYLALMALTQQPTLWQAGAALYPIADLTSLYQSTRGDLRAYLEDHIGRPDERPGFFRERSPLHHVERIEAPLLLLQGANDPRTPLSEATRMAEALAALGKLHDFHVYPNEGHGFQRKENREDAFHRVLAFFNQHLNIQ